MNAIERLPGLEDTHQDDIYLRVLPIVRGGYGVYGNAVLIAIYTDPAAADVHCQRLRRQQVEDSTSMPPQLEG
jgi:hypothetical protein